MKCAKGNQANCEMIKAYKQLKDATKSGMTGETATKSWAIVEDALKELGQYVHRRTTNPLPL